MTVLPDYEVENLIQIERDIHYCELPPPDEKSFIFIDRQSPILLSAPHGAITFRNDDQEIWHPEDEYTAGLALLISGLCGTSVIATIWRNEKSDPNNSPKENSDYKQAMEDLLNDGKINWVIDLHGAKEKNERLSDTQKVDVGIGVKREYLPNEVYKMLIHCIEMNLGHEVTDRKGRKGFAAGESGRIAAFAHSFQEVWSLQLEMKPEVRVARRRVNATMYGKPLSEGGGPYTAPANQVLGMMQALVDFIEYLKSIEK